MTCSGFIADGKFDVGGGGDSEHDTCAWFVAELVGTEHYCSAVFGAMAVDVDSGQTVTFGLVGARVRV